MSRSATVTRAWKTVVDRRPLFLSWIVYRPRGDVGARNRAFPSSSRLTDARAIPAPAWVTVPDRRTVRVFRLSSRDLIVTRPGLTDARISTVPVSSSSPLPAAYGVASAFQTVGAVGAVKTLERVKDASRSRTPPGAPPGGPCGTSTGGKQTTSW